MSDVEHEYTRYFSEMAVELACSPSWNEGVESRRALSGLILGATESGMSSESDVELVFNRFTAVMTDPVLPTVPTVPTMAAFRAAHARQVRLGLRTGHAAGQEWLPEWAAGPGPGSATMGDTGSAVVEVGDETVEDLVERGMTLTGGPEARFVRSAGVDGLEDRVRRVVREELALALERRDVLREYAAILRRVQ